MFYIELYLCDYLKAEGGERRETELWGEQRGEHFYICHLRREGERKPFFRAHMQYLGNYLGMESAGMGKVTLFYRREGEVYRQEAAVYVARETEQIEHFLIRERATEKRGAEQNRKYGMEKTAETERGGKTAGGIFMKTVVCAVLLLLTANMVEALSSYRNIQEVIEIVELLMK